MTKVSPIPPVSDAMKISPVKPSISEFRRGGVTEADVLQSLLSDPSSSVDSHHFKFGPPMLPSVRLAFICIFGILLFALLVSTAGLLSIYFVSSADEEPQNTYRKSMFVTVATWGISSHLCGFIIIVNSTWYLRRRGLSLHKIILKASMIFLPIGVYLIFVYLLLIHLSTNINKYVMSLFCIIEGFFGIVMTAYVGLKMTRTNDPEMIAKFEAKKKSGQVKGKTALQMELTFIKLSVQAAMPCLFVNAVQTFYIVIIFPLYTAFDMNTWRVFVFITAFALKATGNKALVKLLLHLGALEGVMGEFTIFWYEFTTALMCRILLLSVPDASIAIAMSLLNTTAETQIRNWFYMLYMTAGLKLDSSTEDNERKKELKAEHWRFGRARVADACNDMSVEYITAIIGAYLIYKLSDPDGPFVISGDNNSVHSPEVIIQIVSYQLIPEIFVDFYCTLLEIKGGLMSQHEHYWRNIVKQEGLVATLCKVVWTPCIVGWVMLMMINGELIK